MPLEFTHALSLACNDTDIIVVSHKRSNEKNRDLKTTLSVLLLHHLLSLCRFKDRRLF